MQRFYASLFGIAFLVFVDIYSTVTGLNGSRERGMLILLSQDRVEQRLERIEANQLMVLKSMTRN